MPGPYCAVQIYSLVSNALPSFAFLALLLLVGCIDNPAAPGTRQIGSSDGASLDCARTGDGSYACDAVVVPGGGSGDDSSGSDGSGTGETGTCDAETVVESCEHGAGGGSGGESEPTQNAEPHCTPDAYGTVCEIEERPECERPNANSDVCVTRDPSEDEWGRIGDIIDRMTTGADYCRAAKAQAQEMYAAGRINGRIRLWNGRNYIPGTNNQGMIWGRNGSDWRGRTLELDSYLVFATRSLLAHEALHAYLNANNVQMSPADQELWIRARETECAG